RGRLRRGRRPGGPRAGTRRGPRARAGRRRRGGRRRRAGTRRTPPAGREAARGQPGADAAQVPAAQVRAAPPRHGDAQGVLAGQGGAEPGPRALTSGYSRRMIDAVVFDMDGVLVDSEPVWEEVRRAVVAEHGGTWQPDTQRRLMGMSTSEWASYLSGELGVALSPAEVADVVIGGMAARYDDRL